MTDGMNARARTLLGCLVIAVAGISCSESITNPSTPGSGLLNRNVTIRDTLLQVVSDTCFLERIIPDEVALLPLRLNLVGKTTTYTAYTALRFSIGLPRDTINVLSATMNLRLVIWVGDSSGTFAFDVHSANSPWSESTFMWDTVSRSGFYDQAVKGTYSSTVGPDTQVISVPLDTAMVRGWYQTNTTTNNGIVLVPRTNSSIIRGIHAFAYDSVQFQPQLVVIARNTSGTVTDTTTIQIGADSYAADVNQSFLSPQRLFTQAGIVYRSTMKFRLDSTIIPRGAIINSAELLLVRDPALTRVSRFTTSPQPVVQTLLTADSSNYEAPFAPGALKDGTTNTFSFDVRRQVQLWEKNNYGLILRQVSANEVATLDVFAFYSNDAADPALRPRILVKYSIFQ